MIGSIEEAILTRIRAASDAGTLGYRVRTITSLPSESLDDFFTREVIQFPAVAAVFAGCPTPEDMGRGQTWRYAPTFVLVVAAANARNERATRQGAAGEVGSYQLAHDVTRLLVGQRLGLEIDPLEPGPVRSLFTGAVRKRPVSLYGVELRTRFVLEGLGTEELPDFATFHANWDVPPLGTVAAPLPADDTADATDDVAVPTT